MTCTFRVTFHEWQKFELVVPAKTDAEATRIAQTLLNSIGTVWPFVEIDGGTEYFEAYGPSRPLGKDDIDALKIGLRVMRNHQPIDNDPDDAHAIRLLTRGLRRLAPQRR